MDVAHGHWRRDIMAKNNVFSAAGMSGARLSLWSRNFQAGASAPPRASCLSPAQCAVKMCLPMKGALCVPVFQGI